ncbi:hypothetical protein [Halocynthiibacter styelae]|uniref:Uncharacterized protein n=1 Tax=Halocynthiibacter styelae TaxID=2761955 RepID=A0A8J7LQ64_9RHOB|nr:hypothetical protein [Paenihalocynthiibacter styelae]MBI1494666.1 hypothetical protein [Paenihalocynthiibacter styelae]
MKVIIGVYRTLSVWLVVPVLMVTSVLWWYGVHPDDLDEFIGKYQNLTIALGTLLIVFVLAVLGTYLANVSAEKREETNRKVQSELQIAQFRQAWINQMRDDISEFTHLSFVRSGGVVDKKISWLYFKIGMSLNTEEDLANSLGAAMHSATQCPETDKADASDAVARAGREYLKKEWNRLKKDIRDAQLLKEDK